MKNKKGITILVENVIYVVLVLLFFTILFLFVSNQAAGTSELEEAYAKQIALILDASEKENVIILNIEDLISEIIDVNDNDLIRIDGNKVCVKLENSGGYCYGYFNDLNIEKELDKEGGNLVLRIGK
jgi:hypothetical protein